eukprot:10443868-Lingulodinium_polyedra.AAC.1
MFCSLWVSRNWWLARAQTPKRPTATSADLLRLQKARNQFMVLAARAPYVPDVLVYDVMVGGEGCRGAPACPTGVGLSLSGRGLLLSQTMQTKRRTF